MRALLGCVGLVVALATNAHALDLGTPNYVDCWEQITATTAKHLLYENVTDFRPFGNTGVRFVTEDGGFVILTNIQCRVTAPGAGR